jgi:hypothetical protein
VAEDRPQAGGERQPALGVDLDLVDAPELVLDGSSIVTIFRSTPLMRDRAA